MICAHALLMMGLVLARPGQTADSAGPQVVPPECVECHGQRKSADCPLPPVQALPRSVHQALACTDCHAWVDVSHTDAAQPRPLGEVEPVDCGGCHEDAADIYEKHGRMAIGNDPDTPACWDCHGVHDILPSSDRGSHVHPVNLPTTCRACHTNVDMVKKHDILREAPIKLYQASVHGRATQKGIYVAATCNDCHSSPNDDGQRTAHRILSASDPQSTIYHFVIPDTCGQCHEPIAKDFWEGIHGKMVKNGSVDSPVCTHCHGEHGIISPTDPRSPVSPAHVAEQTCAPCHESAVLNEKYGLPGHRLASYIDSYHGLKGKAGDSTVANCASCHGAHRILPSGDPTSSIFPANLQATCGECHPGISTELAQTLIHETATGIYSGWAEFFRKFYLWLIGITIGLMLLHNCADWIRQVLVTSRRPFVQRLNFNEVVQHTLLMVSFIALVLTGFSLRFSETWWVTWMFGWQGGFEMRGELHRIFGVLFMFSIVWHALYLMGRRGRQVMRDMIASRRDLVNIMENSLYFLGRRAERPQFGRFSYMEKCEYWALVWGAAIMIFTGLFLWFDDVAVRFVPKGFLDVMLVIHYYEAWLATLAILVWHIYSTVFSPSVYPMNPAWLSGRMPRDMYLEEHPAGPRLKARVVRPRLEEELEDEGSVPETTSKPTPEDQAVGSSAGDGNTPQDR